MNWRDMTDIERTPWGDAQLVKALRWAGYMRISRKHGLVARIDRPDWKDWTERTDNPIDPYFFCRVLTHDTIKLPNDLALQIDSYLYRPYYRKPGAYGRDLAGATDGIAEERAELEERKREQDTRARQEGIDAVARELAEILWVTDDPPPDIHYLLDDVRKLVTEWHSTRERLAAKKELVP